MSRRTNEAFAKVGRFLFLLTLPAALLSAQSETATLRGTVTDSAGAPLATITVVITEASTNVEARRVTTGASGNYEALWLKPGLYKLSIEEKDYQTFSADGILLDPGQVRRMDPKLVAGAPEDTTEAHLGVSLIDTQTGTIRGLIDNKVRWHDAPVVEKTPSPFALLATAPGIQGNGRGLVMSGKSDRNQQTWAMDGIADDATAGQYSHPIFFEMLQVTAANPGVEAYRASGFNMVSKRGANDFHGAIFYKRGASTFDARPYFDTRKNRYILHEEGGEFGGPMARDHAFFYGGWVHQSNPYSETLYADVPTAQMRSRDFSQFLDPKISPTGKAVVIRDPRNGVPFPNNLIPANRLSAVPSSFVTNYYPSPNAGDANTFIQNYSWTHPFGPDVYRANWPFVRGDLKVSDHNNLYARFMETATSSIAAGSIGEQLDSTQLRKYKSVAVSDTEAFSSSLVNRLTAGFTADSVKQGQNEGHVSPLHGDSVISTTGLQGTNLNGYGLMGFPTTSISGLTGLSMVYGGGFTKDVTQDDGILTLQDAVAWSKGKHSVKLGAQYTRFYWLEGALPQNNYGSFTFNGVFTGLGFADFLLGFPATSSRLLDPKPDEKLHQEAAGAYLTDSFRATSRLTVDYGVRWDYFRSPVYQDGYMYNWDPATGSVVVAPGTITSVSTWYPKAIKVVVGQVVPRAKTTNLRPRVSAAYRLSDSLVLRGGYGEFTDGGGYGSSGRLNDPYGPYRLAETYNNTNTNGLVAYSFPKPFPAAPSSSLTGTQSITALPMKTDEGVIRQYNATLEGAVSGLGLRASYIGSRGVGMNYTLDINKPRAGTAPFAVSRLPYPQFASTYVTRADGQWRYDSAQFEAQKKVGNVTFDSSITWANNRSNYANVFDPYNVTAHWIRDGSDRRLYWVTSAVWALPVGKGRRWLSDAGPMVNRVLSNWTLQAIATAASGQYYSPLFTGPDPANASPGYVTALPDCTGDPNSGARTITKWFNPAAFAAPPASAGRYGTCGMNILEGYPIHVAHMSLAKRVPINEWLTATLTVQVSNVTNTPHFTIPNRNISNPGAGAFTASSMVPDYYPERQGSRQLDVKIRFHW